MTTIQIITTSYPSAEAPIDGVFVREFVLQLVREGCRVLVHVPARRRDYLVDDGVTVVPMAWRGQGGSLASSNLANPLNWLVAAHFLLLGAVQALRVGRAHSVSRMLCMWVVPSGLIGFCAHLLLGTSYDVYALGSDIWKIRAVPLVGPWLIRLVVSRANRVYADGTQLAADVTELTGRPCALLTLGRVLPAPKELPPLEPQARIHLLFVGRYHVNKGPDLLLEALRLLDPAVRRQLKVHAFGLGDMESALRRDVERYGLAETITIGPAIGAQDFVDCLRRVAYLVLPSRVDSIPVVVIDALQSGVPVIAMPVGDLPLLIGRYRCGILAKGPTAAAFADAVAEGMATDPAAFAPGVRAAAAQFDIQTSVRRWLSESSP